MKKIVKDSREYLGKEVDAVMDRPLGTKHPKWGFIYDVNYGNIPNTISGDGEELDVYVLGEDKPLEKFSGVVKAIIHRTNNDDDKLVMMSPEKNFSKREIYEKVKFQEKFFNSKIIWLDGTEEDFIISEKYIETKVK